MRSEGLPHWAISGFPGGIRNLWSKSTTHAYLCPSQACPNDRSSGQRQGQLQGRVTRLDFAPPAPSPAPVGCLVGHAYTACSHVHPPTPDPRDDTISSSEPGPPVSLKGAQRASRSREDKPPGLGQVITHFHRTL